MIALSINKQTNKKVNLNSDQIKNAKFYINVLFGVLCWCKPNARIC